MYKKSIFLVLLLVPSYGKAFWEIPAAIAFGWSMKTKIGQEIRSAMYARMKKSVANSNVVNNIVMPRVDAFKVTSSARVANFAPVKYLSESERFALVCIKAQNVALETKKATLSGFTLLQARMNNLMPRSSVTQSFEQVATVESVAAGSATVVPTTTASVVTTASVIAGPAIVQPMVGQSAMAQSTATLKSFVENLKQSASAGTASAGTAGAGSQNAIPVSSNVNHFTKVDAASVNQTASGFFPRVTNNYYSGSAPDVTKEFGKKRLLQGIIIGASGMYSMQSLKEKSAQAA